MILALFRIVFIAFVLFIIFTVVRFFQQLGTSKGTGRNPKAVQGIMVKDEVCKMYLPREEAIREVRDGKEYFFCSKDCREKFLKAKSETS